MGVEIEVYENICLYQHQEIERHLKIMKALFLNYGVMFILSVKYFLNSEHL